MLLGTSNQKFNNSKLKRVQLKKASECMDDDTICYATRAKCSNSKPSSSQDNCLFCDDDSKSEHLHDFTTFNSDVSVNVMATQMSDTS